MWKSRRTWLCAFGLIAVALAIYIEPTYCVRGWLHGEAFFDGRPTSWWRIEVERYEMQRDRCGPLGYSRTRSLFEKTRDRWFPRVWTDEELHEIFQGPSILRVNEEAVPVLRALRDDPSPKVRDFAQFGLLMNGIIPDKD